MAKNPSRTTRNRLLSALTRDDHRRLQPLLEAVDLPLRRNLEDANRRIEYIYFIESGFASVVANGSAKRAIEVGLIGREGMTGLAILMGTDRSPHETYMQLGGSGLRLSAAACRQEMDRSATLQRTFLNYAHTFMVQTAQSALANGRSKIEERLARWLLMAHDRIDGDELRLTHEFLSVMLGLYRPGVTLALNLLERRALITASRGTIRIIDRKGLEESTNGSYGASESEYARLFA